MDIEVKVIKKDGTKDVYKYAAQDKYDKDNTVRQSYKFNKKTDADILEFLEKSGNKAGTVKKALRAYMQKENQ